LFTDNYRPPFPRPQGHPINPVPWWKRIYISNLLFYELLDRKYRNLWKTHLLSGGYFRMKLGRDGYVPVNFYQQFSFFLLLFLIDVFIFFGWELYPQQSYCFSNSARRMKAFTGLTSGAKSSIIILLVPSHCCPIDFRTPELTVNHPYFFDCNWVVIFL